MMSRSLRLATSIGPIVLPLALTVVWCAILAQRDSLDDCGAPWLGDNS